MQMGFCFWNAKRKPTAWPNVGLEQSERCSPLRGEPRDGVERKLLSNFIRDSKVPDDPTLNIRII